jgi:stress-induced morphogen
MALKKEVFESVINANFKDVKFILTDMVGDEDHYSLEISSPEFKGLSHLQRHRLINSRLKDYIGSKVHALTILSINVI